MCIGAVRTASHEEDEDKREDDKIDLELEELGVGLTHEYTSQRISSKRCKSKSQSTYCSTYVRKEWQQVPCNELVAFLRNSVGVYELET